MKTPRCFRWMAVWSGLFLATAGVFAQGFAVIPAQSVWRYLDNGLLEGTSWVTRLYDDSAWSSGPGRLGFGGDGEQTLLQSGHITYYFRRAFTVTNTAALSNLQVRLKRDDGAIVYLNGVEIFRSNMPVGPVDSLTPAASTVDGTDETNVFASPVLTSSVLANGANVVAAEVHQLGPNSSDLGFDLELVGNIAVPTSFTVPVAAGWSTLANNFNRGGNTLNEVLPHVADGTEIYVFNPATQSYSNSVYDGFAASWTANFSLNPGQGAWIHSLAPQSLTFIGQISAPPPVTRPATASRRFVSCRQPVSSTFQEVMGFAPADGDQIFTYEGVFPTLPAQPTRVFAFRDGVWTPTLPLLGPGRSFFADLVVPQPVIVVQPQDQTVFEGIPVIFSVVANGATPFSYQWKSAGTPLTGATNKTHTRPGGATNDSGPYTVSVKNSFGEALSVEARLDLIPTNCEIIFHCPMSISTTCVSNGAVVTYSATAGNSCNSTVVNLSCDPPSGSFFPAGMRMINCNGTVLGRSVSCSFTVTVQSNCAPVILSQPRSLSAREGDSATFTAQAGGAPPLTFQWRKDGVAIPDAILNYLSLTNVMTSDAGAYSCVVSNPYGSVTSSNAILTITPIFWITFRIANNGLALQWDTNLNVQLQAAEDLAGPWVEVPGAGSPHVVDMIGPRRFFRLFWP